MASLFTVYWSLCEASFSGVATGGRPAHGHIQLVHIAATRMKQRPRPGLIILFQRQTGGFRNLHTRRASYDADRKSRMSRRAMAECKSDPGLLRCGRVVLQWFGDDMAGPDREQGEPERQVFHGAKNNESRSGIVSPRCFC